MRKVGLWVVGAFRTEGVFGLGVFGFGFRAKGLYLWARGFRIWV